MCFSNIDIKKNKERCLELLRSTGMGYFTAPASSYYHLNVDVIIPIFVTGR